MELIGLYLIACSLLVVAGVAKAIRPSDTARALSGVLPIGLRPMTVMVRVGSGAEAALGAVALVRPGPASAGLVALSYAAFSVFVAYARSRGGTIASCGCFGTPDTPATVVHAVINVVLALSAAAVAWAAASGSTASVLSRQPLHGWPLVAVSAVGAWLVALTISRLAVLQAARRLTAVSFDRRP